MATVTFRSPDPPQQIKVYEIFGIVKSNKRLQGTKCLLNIHSVSSNRDYKIDCDFFCPAKRGDVITGFCVQENKPMVGQFTFVNPPAVEPSSSRDAIQNAFLIALRGTKFSSHLSDKLYRFFEEETLRKINDKNEESVYRNRNNLSTAVLEIICMFANRFKTNESIIDPLVEIGLTKAQAIKILSWWYNNYSLRRLYLLGLTKTEIRESCERGWSTDTLYYQLLENPYIVETVPMEKVQSIALRYKMSFDQNMVESAHLVRYADKRTNSRGWTCHPIYPLTKIYPRYHELEKTLKTDFKCSIKYNCIYLRHQAIVEDILTDTLKPEKLPETYCSSVTKEKLSNEQTEAVELVLNNKVSIITGSAGTGKTTVISSIAEELELRNIEYIIGSFTGKAVARLKEVVRRHDKIMTLHMLLSRAIKLEKVKYLIIDEISMVPNGLLGFVLKKLISMYDTINIVLVGDPNQVQPIDCGDLFNQILMADTIPVAHLITDHRRNKNGSLKSNTTRFGICDDPYEFIFEWGTDCEFKEGEIETVEAIAKHLFTSGVSHTDITIITPFNKDLDDINKRCQSIFLDENAPKSTDSFGNIWIVGTRVMMTKNRYDINVMNGEEGIVTQVSKFKPVIIVKFNNGEEVEIPTFVPEIIQDFDSNSKEEALSTKLLKMSWAITIHKSQGSEWSKVIYVAQNTGKSSFVNRNLVYTGISRAKENLYVVGSSKNKFEACLYINPSIRVDNLAKRLLNEPYKETFVLSMPKLTS